MSKNGDSWYKIFDKPVNKPSVVESSEYCSPVSVKEIKTVSKDCEVSESVKDAIAQSVAEANAEIEQEEVVQKVNKEVLNYLGDEDFSEVEATCDSDFFVAGVGMKKTKTPWLVSKTKPVATISAITDKPVGENVLYRPTTFAEYIGQSRAKSVLESYIKATKNRNVVFPHLLIHGNAGCGKTTLAKIVAHQLGVNFVETITSAIETPEALYKLINKVNGGVLFLDEIHGLERENCERLYSIMEDFKNNGRAIKPFTLIGATTEMGEMLKTRRPFCDRFKILLELENYTDSELAGIGQQYLAKMYPNDSINANVVLEMAGCARSTPRLLIRLLEAVVFSGGNHTAVLNNYNIIKLGYTTKDLKALKYIEQNDKGCGVNSIASYLGTSVTNFTYDIEPYLIQNNLIVRTPRGRKITDDGKNMIKELSHVNTIPKVPASQRVRANTHNKHQAVPSTLLRKRT